MAQGQAIPMHGDGSSERDYPYITDAVAGVLGALAWNEGARAGACVAFNIGGGEGVRVDRLIQTIGGALGRTPRVERYPHHPGGGGLTAARLGRAGAGLGCDPR